MNTHKRYSTLSAILLVLTFGSFLLVNTTNISGKTVQPAGTSAGQDVVNFYWEVFKSDWSRGTAYDPNVDGMGFAASRDDSGSPNFVRKAAKTVSSNMNITPILSPDNSETKTIALIQSAQTSLYIEQMYIYDELTDIINAIIAAKNRGVDVKVLFGEGKDDENGVVASQLHTAGVAVKECDGTAPLYFDTVHNKGVIVDGRLVLLASINWSPNSLRDNREAGLIIESTDVATYYTGLFNTDWDGSDPYDPGTSFKLPLPGCVENSLVNPMSAPKTATYTNQFANPSTFTGSMTVKAISSPDNCYDAVIAELAKAQGTIDVSVYTFSSPFLMDVIADRIAAGVKVRLLLGKPLGSYELNYNRWTMMNFTNVGIPSKADPTKNNTAQGLWADPDFDYQHCKYAIIDNKTLIISSGNWSQNSCPKPDKDDEVSGNRDWWFIVYGTGSTPSNTDNNEDDDLLGLLDDIPGYSIMALIPAVLLGIVFLIRRQKH